jgi:hypothetical protein
MIFEVASVRSSLERIALESIPSVNVSAIPKERLDDL